MVIGFFAPLPLALMIPFMAGQSLAMGEAFGKGFQYGKRKISAMDNTAFNNLTFKGLAEQIATDYSELIPTLQQSIKDSKSFQSDIIVALADMLKSIPNDILKGLFGIDPFNLENFGQPTGTPGSNPEPDLNLPGKLINVSADVISSWSNVKLAHEHNANLQKYDIPSQQRISTFFQQRIKGKKQSSEPGTPLKNIPLTNWYNPSVLKRLTGATRTKQLKAITNRLQASQMLNPLFASAKSQLKEIALNPRGKATIKKYWEEVLQDVLYLIKQANANLPT